MYVLATCTTFVYYFFNTNGINVLITFQVVVKVTSLVLHFGSAHVNLLVEQSVYHH